MKALIIFSLFSLLVFSSCARTSDEYPKDFSLVLDWDTGALPPEYHYQYTISIGPGPQAEFVYHPGYEATAENTWITSFVISEADLQKLFNYLEQKDVLRNRWATGELLVGGQGTSISITAFDQQYLIPGVSEVNREERELIEQLIEEIKSYVPDQIWEEMERRQSEYETSYYD